LLYNFRCAVPLRFPQTLFIVSMRSFALSLPALLTGTIAAYSDQLQNILQNTDKSDKYHYPTDFTREIVPKPFHSHNDYWRDVPFYTGLSYGSISTEADVWLINGTLYVGSLKQNRRSFLHNIHCRVRISERTARAQNFLRSCTLRMTSRARLDVDTTSHRQLTPQD
jgi:hypothetical protein